MKYIWRVLVIVLCVLIVIGIGFMGTILPQRSNSLFVEWGGEMKLVQETDFDLSKVDKINIDFGSEEVVILPSESDQLEMKQYMNYEPSERELATLWRTGNTLDIKQGERDFILFSSFGKRERVEIYLPEFYQDALKIEIGSGSLRIDQDMTLTDFDLELHSGNVTTESIVAEEIKVELSSGKITIGQLIGEQDVKVSSGHLSIQKSTGNGKYQCSSGQMDVGVSELLGDMDVEVMSGKCEITLPEDASFEYESKISSGDIDTYFDTDHNNDKRSEAVIGDQPTGKIKVDVSSGRVNIIEE